MANPGQDILDVQITPIMHPAFERARNLHLANRRIEALHAGATAAVSERCPRIAHGRRPAVPGALTVNFVGIITGIYDDEIVVYDVPLLNGFDFLPRQDAF